MERCDSGSGLRALAIVAFCAATPVLYLLSSGPALWIAKNTDWPPDIVFQTVYWPFRFGGENIRGFAEIRDWYWSFWM